MTNSRTRTPGQTTDASPASPTDDLRASLDSLSLPQTPEGQAPRLRKEALKTPPRPPGLVDPLAPPPRLMELLASLQPVAPEMESVDEALMQDYEGKLLCRLVSVCNATGQGVYVRSRRALTTRDRKAILDAFIIGQQLAIAQAILLSDLSTPKEQESALEYVERIRQSIALYSEETARWLNLARTLDGVPPDWSEPLSPSQMLTVRGLLATAGDLDLGSVDDRTLLDLLSAWRAPRRDTSKWRTFTTFCRAVKVDTPPETTKTSKPFEAIRKAYQRHKLKPSIHPPPRGK